MITNNKNEAVFLDIEACQEQDRTTGETKHRLLQLGAIKYLNNKELDFFNYYIKYEKKLYPKIKYLLSKDERFFRKQKYSEKEIYLRFVKFVGNRDCYSFGDYDQIVLDDVYDNNNLKCKRIKIHDFAELFQERYSIDKNLTPSLKNLCYVYNIDQKYDHDAKSDAFILFKICKKYFSNLNSNIDYKKRLFDEFLRPKFEKLNSNYFKGEVIKPKIDNNYLFIFDKSKILPNKVEITENGRNVNTIDSYSVTINIVVKQNDGKKILSFSEKQNFKFKMDAIDFMKQFYINNILEYMSNAIVLYDTCSRFLLKALQQQTKNLSLYYYVSTKKIEAHFKLNNLIFKNIDEEHDYLIKFINNFYDPKSQSFSKFI